MYAQFTRELGVSGKHATNRGTPFTWDRINTAVVLHGLLALR